MVVSLTLGLPANPIHKLSFYEVMNKIMGHVRLLKF